MFVQTPVVDGKSLSLKHYLEDYLIRQSPFCFRLNLINSFIVMYTRYSLIIEGEWNEKED